ncbi:MAG TPA: biotin carboxylase N-terminal domain-containing protein [Streptosporangiaceae bacterium]|nr:biotin carboxylase N-terminal domain-containing protein [Streptosporangiaceae bacterium]
MRKVLIANRGEIAVRVARACRDAGLESVAVYADPDRDAPHVRLAGDAYALGGVTPAETYLDIAKLLEVATRSGADAVHPGYGFLSENADFAEAVTGAGITWIGPPPQAIRQLGDKIAAREVAQRVGAPLVAGRPVAGAGDVAAFAGEHGLPVAIKAAYGGGGRGLKVAWTPGEIADQYDSATREAVAAFGRGECFVERYLDRPRHVETQCLADAHGNVVVISTRDCTLQRRHQKLVEEAPAPFLTPDQVARLYEASKAIMREAGYVGAGTCEFLVGADGVVSFLEVNTRLQVEHPVSEEITGLDLVREQFRLAEGAELGYDDPPAHGHSIEFRINAEDPGRAFLPGPGALTAWQVPAGPGVRVDSGVAAGAVIGREFDSMLAKLIVTGRDRSQALERARRALAEFEVEGVATVLPFHRAVVDDPAFAPADPAAPFAVHTRWIESDFRGCEPQPEPAEPPERPAHERLTVEVNGRRMEVVVPALGGPPDIGVRRMIGRRMARLQGVSGASSGDHVTCPMQGSVVKVAAPGDRVEVGDPVVVIEAMKMEQPVAAHRAGVVTDLAVAVGDAVSAGQVICRITD